MMAGVISTDPTRDYHPGVLLGRRIEEALDPVRAPGKVKIFTVEERLALEQALKKR